MIRYRLLTVFHSPSSPFADWSPPLGLSSAGGPRFLGPPLSLSPILGPDLQLSPPSPRPPRSSLRGPRSSPPRGPRLSPLGPLSSRGPRSSLPPRGGPSLSPRGGPLSFLSFGRLQLSSPSPPLLGGPLSTSRSRSSNLL